MRRRKARVTEALSLSFLDVITAGFGAIVLLLVITKLFEPDRREEARDETQATIAYLEQRLEDLREDTATTSERLSRTEAELLAERERLRALSAELARLESAQDAVRSEAELAAELEERLRRARQELTEEMQRLLAQIRPEHMDREVGGIPVDSEYIVFVIDTSPSMTEFTWPRMMRIMEEILDVYPEVKGMQVMNDMGTHLFRRRAGDWIEDSRTLRDTVLRRLQTWRPFSNSSPVEGLIEAVRTYATDQHGVSIYYLGDEMHGRDLHGAARDIRNANRGPDGGSLARIHSVGFPVIYDYTGAVQETGLRFASLMRIVCEHNDGTFVALHSGRDAHRGRGPVLGTGSRR